MAQHPVHLNLGSAQCWGIPHLPGEIIPMPDCSNYKTVGQYCQGPSICRGQTSVSVHKQTPPSGRWVCVCVILDFCSQGLEPNRTGKERSEESVENLCLFSIVGY